MTDVNSEQITQLDPVRVLADDNGSKWSPKARETDIERLMASILENGGVMEPVEVTEIPKADRTKNGFTHRLTFGFNRHTAVTRLNIEQGAGLTLPCIVRPVEDGATRLKRQISENNDRATLSPMDKAVAIKRLLDTGLIKADVRRIFSAAGGRKGNQVQPMSSAMLNIHLNLLDLPKSIQMDIHEGAIGIEGAYMLGKVPPEKRQAVIDRAKKDRAAQIEQEEKDEQRYLAAEQRVVETEAKVGEAETAIETARGEVTAAEELVKARIEEMKAVKIVIAQKETAADAGDVEASKGAEQNVKSAQKVLKDAKNKLAKALGTRTTAEEAVNAVKAKLEASRAAVKKGKKGASKSIGKVAVSKAAAAEGTKAGIVPVGIGDIRQTLKDMVAGKLGADDRVSQVASCFKDCFDGKDTEKELVIRLDKLLDAMGAKLVAKVKPTPPAAPDVKQGPKAAAAKAPAVKKAS